MISTATESPLLGPQLPELFHRKKRIFEALGEELNRSRGTYSLASTGGPDRRALTREGRFPGVTGCSERGADTVQARYRGDYPLSLGTGSIRHLH